MMPVGVPRVPYRLPKGGAWVWIDIWNCLVSVESFPFYLRVPLSFRKRDDYKNRELA